MPTSTFGSPDGGKWRRTCARSAEPTLLAQPPPEVSAVRRTRWFGCMPPRYHAALEFPAARTRQVSSQTERQTAGCRVPGLRLWRPGRIASCARWRRIDEICPSCGFEFGVDDDDVVKRTKATEKDGIAGGMKGGPSGGHLHRIGIRRAVENAHAGPRKSSRFGAILPNSEWMRSSTLRTKGSSAEPAFAERSFVLRVQNSTSLSRGRAVPNRRSACNAGLFGEGAVDHSCGRSRLARRKQGRARIAGVGVSSCAPSRQGSRCAVDCVSGDLHRSLWLSG